MTRTLVLGGARSGKSAYAEALAGASGKHCLYLATARAGDDEMRARIAQHRAQRPQHWPTIEEPLALGRVLREHGQPDNLLLIDCLTLWLSNLLFAQATDFPEVGVITLPEIFHIERASLLDALDRASGDIVLVSNEVGMGIVPVGAVSRCYADEAGRLNQAVAACCDRVVLVVAGLPLVLKGAPC